MRLLCLAFPRLAVQLARRRAPELGASPLILVSGSADEALVSAVSPEASAAGISSGMLATTARSRCARLVTIPDNAGDCLAALDHAAAILRSRATTNVAVASREHLIIDLRGLEDRFPDEETAAAALLTLTRSWTGLDVRAGVAATSEAAFAAARAARRVPVVTPDDESEPERLVFVPDTALAAHFAWEVPAKAADVRVRVVRMLSQLERILDARGESFRSLSLAIWGAEGDHAAFRLASREPLHHAADGLALLAPHLVGSLLDGAVRVEVGVATLGPSTLVQHARTDAERSRFVPAPVRPVQRPLLRAS